jgi:predicted 3-demethylubiquinone-9 3-methyltransferase (glyoxalase superfamily)
MSKTVLVVDDSTSMRQMVSFTMKEAGFDVIEGANGEEALSHVQGKAVNLVITDLNMPVMDGMTLIRQLRAKPEFKFTPAISFFVSCQSAEEIDQLWQALSQGGGILMPLERYPFSEKFGWLNDRYGVSWQLSLARTPQKIDPYLLFTQEQNGKAEEAMRFYTGLFKEAGIDRIDRFEPGEGGDENAVKHGRFHLAAPARPGIVRRAAAR